MRTPKTIAIVGAGIGGLSAGVALSKSGHHVTIFEQAEAIKPLGTSLSLWPNAMQCLRDFGVEKTVKNKGSILAAIAARDMAGKPFFRAELSGIYEEIGAVGIVVRRSDLHNALADALPSGALVLNHCVTGVSQRSDKVGLTFQNGEASTFDLVIGADGLNSVMRQHVLNDGPPRYAGYGAWLGVSPTFPKGPDPDEICEYYGSNGRFGMSPTGGGACYWFFVENHKTPRQKPGPADSGDLRKALDVWPDFARSLAESQVENDLIYAPFYDRRPSKIWGNGRILLLGDAIHPFTPNLGQGGCQSIEDAWTLGKLCETDLSPAELLGAYQKARVKRAAVFATQSRQIGQVLQMTHPAARWLRGLAIRSGSAGSWKKRLRSHFARPPLG